MSEALKTPTAQAFQTTPQTPEGGRLPRAPQQVAANRSQDDRFWFQAWCQADELARKNGDSPALPPCANALHIILCFDGTNNHEPSDKLAKPSTTTNVARLYHASVGPGNGEAGNEASDFGFFCYYVPGVGTEFKEIGEFEPSAAGLKYAPGGENRINWALTRLIDAVQLTCTKNRLKDAAALALIQRMAASAPLQYLSLGQADDGQARPDDPHCPSSYRAGTEEYLYPGMHSDVGGGYPPCDQGKAWEGGQYVLSQVALHHMYDAAYQAGAPLQAPNSALDEYQRKDWPWLVMTPEIEIEFGIADTLIERFNAWAAQVPSLPLEEAMARELGLITGWRIARFVRGQSHLPYYQAMRGRDVRPEEREAFETLHRYQLAEDAAVRRGESPPTLSPRQQAERERAQAVRRAYEARTGGNPEAPLNTHKLYEPPLDQQQMDQAAEEFRRDYVPMWNFMLDRGGWCTSELLNALLGGLVYMTNDADEAQEYVQIRTDGQQAHQHLFRPDHHPAQSLLVALFDDHVHDSRAGFMHAQLNGRETWTDYFRYRCIFFDSSNKRLSLLANGVWGSPWQRWSGGAARSGWKVRGGGHRPADRSGSTDDGGDAGDACVWARQCRRPNRSPRPRPPRRSCKLFCGPPAGRAGRGERRAGWRLAGSGKG